MRAGYENNKFYILLEQKDTGAGLRNSGYYFHNHDKKTGTILLLKKRIIFIVENKESPKLKEWFKKIGVNL